MLKLIAFIGLALSLIGCASTTSQAPSIDAGTIVYNGVQDAAVIAIAEAIRKNPGSRDDLVDTEATLTAAIEAGKLDSALLDSAFETINSDSLSDGARYGILFARLQYVRYGGGIDIDQAEHLKAGMVRLRDALRLALAL